MKQAQLKCKKGVRVVWTGVCEEKEKPRHFPLFSQRKEKKEKRNPKLSCSPFFSTPHKSSPGTRVYSTSNASDDGGLRRQSCRRSGHCLDLMFFSFSRALLRSRVLRARLLRRILSSKHESLSRKLPVLPEPPVTAPTAAGSVAGLRCIPSLSFFFSREPR